MSRIFTFLFLFVSALTKLDGQCLNDSVYQYTYEDSAASGTLTGRMYYTYNSQKHQTGEEGFYLDAGKWFQNYKFIISSNSDGSRASSIQQGKNAQGQWYDVQQTIYTYVSPKKYDEIHYKNWDSTNKIWTNVFIRKYLYGVGGRDSVSSVVYWQNNQWVNFTSAVTSYNGQGQVSEIVTSAWVSGSWQLNSRSLFTYTGNTGIEEIKQVYQAGTWAPSSRILKTLTASGKLKTKIQQNWNSTYWVNSTQEDYLYTTSGCSSSVHYYMNWNSNNSTWGYHLQDSFFSFLTGIHDIVNNKLQVYPNPADRELFIDAVDEGTYTLTDISGRIALEGKIETGINLISTGHLEPGIYILRTKEGSSVVMLQ